MFLVFLFWNGPNHKNIAPRFFLMNFYKWWHTLVYTLFVRSLLEYCCVTWHSSLTIAQADDIERVQRTSLKVILGEAYMDYESALDLCGLETLFKRRESRCLTFGLRSIKHPKHKQMFPLNEISETNQLRNKNKFKVNFARTSSYKNSSIPYIQNMLNDYFKQT